MRKRPRSLEEEADLSLSRILERPRGEEGELKVAAREVGLGRRAVCRKARHDRDREDCILTTSSREKRIVRISC